jgi:hypothetical protein
MKKFYIAMTALFLMAGASIANATIVEFDAFNIRNADSSITGPWDGDLDITENAEGDGFNAMTSQGGQKVGYGTNAFDGLQVNLLDSINFNIDPGSATGSYPYLNLWVTDGTNYAVLSLGGDYRGNDLNGNISNWLLYEYDSGAGTDWLFTDTGYAVATNHRITKGGDSVTLSEFADTVFLADPGDPYPSYVTSGAPRGGYGLNLLYGDTAANYVGGMVISDLTVGFDGQEYQAGIAVPEPSAFALLGLGMLMLLGSARKR